MATEWACEVCTFRNAASRSSKCEMCGSPGPEAPQISNVHDLDAMVSPGGGSFHFDIKQKGAGVGMASDTLVIKSVDPDSTAGRQGVRPGCRIIAVNGDPVHTVKEFKEQLTACFHALKLGASPMVLVNYELPAAGFAPAAGAFSGRVDEREVEVWEEFDAGGLAVAEAQQRRPHADEWEAFDPAVLAASEASARQAAAARAWEEDVDPALLAASAAAASASAAARAWGDDIDPAVLAASEAAAAAAAAARAWGDDVDPAILEASRVAAEAEEAARRVAGRQRQQPAGGGPVHPGVGTSAPRGMRYLDACFAQPSLGLAVGFSEEGAMVVDVVPGGSASMAGVNVGDVIVGVTPGTDFDPVAASATMKKGAFERNLVPSGKALLLKAAVFLPTPTHADAAEVLRHIGRPATITFLTHALADGGGGGGASGVGGGGDGGGGNAIPAATVAASKPAPPPPTALAPMLLPPPPAKSAAPPSPAVQVLKSWRVAWDSLALEARPFATGAGGRVFKGAYMANAVAAKTVNFPDDGESVGERAKVRGEIK